MAVDSQRRAVGPHNIAYVDAVTKADICKTLDIDELGAAPQAGVRHRHRELPGLRRGSTDHRLYRRPRGGREDLHSPRCESPRAGSLPVAAMPAPPQRGLFDSAELPDDHSPKCCDTRGAATVAAGLVVGGRWRSARAHRRSGGFGRRDAGQRLFAGQIEDPTLAPTNARRWFCGTR